MINNRKLSGRGEIRLGQKLKMLGKKYLPLDTSSRELQLLLKMVVMVVMTTAVTAQGSPGSGMKETVFKLLPLNDVMFTQDVLLNALEKSEVTCGRKCVETEGCLMFTFLHSHNGPSGRCLTWGKSLNLTDDWQIASGAVSYGLQELDIAATVPVVCTNGYSLSCGRCLSLLDGSYNYTDAIQQCRELDQGKLITIKTLEDSTCFVAFLEANGFATKIAWLGLDDIETEGIYKWNDETFLPVDSPLWDENQPNGHKAGGDCITLKQETGRFHDILCVAEKKVICEK